MFKLLDIKIPGIWYNPIFSDRYMIANSKDRTIKVFKTEDLSLVCTLGANISYITSYRDYLFASDDEQTFIYRISELGLNPTTVPGLHIIPAYIDDDFIYSNHKTSSSLKIGKYNYHTNDTKLFDYTIGREVLLVNNSLIFSEKAFHAKRIFCLSSETGNAIWVLDVNALGDDLRIFTPILTYKDIISVPVSDNTLYGIDSESGKIIWRRSKTNNLLRGYGSSIVNLDFNGYREISFDNGRTLVEFDLTAEYQKNDFRSMGVNNNFLVTDERVYFNNALGGTVGNLNRKTGRIEWAFKVNTSLTDAPVINGNRLYQLDGDGILHVFERN